MLKKVLVTISVGLLLSISVNASAALISFNGQNVNTLDLNGNFNTFEDFYEYQNASANTGLELTDAVVMFVAELNNELAVFTIANKYNSGGSNGNLFVDLTSATGSVTFTDDPSEMTNTGQLTFNWAGRLTDGYIFSGLSVDDFSFTQELSSRKGINGLSFVDFSDGSLASASYSDLMNINGTFNVSSIAVPISGIFGLVLVGFGFIFRKK